MARVAPSCLALLAQANALWPGRSKASDGTLASARHTKESPGSDHEPRDDPADFDRTRWVCAVDLTDDPAFGCRAHDLARMVVARHDPRLKYAISRGEMASSYPARGYPAWTWRPYSGSNPHMRHAHFSIHNTARARGDTSPWFDPAGPQEADMLFPGTQTVAVPGAKPRPKDNRWPVWGWKPDGSVFCWNFHGDMARRVPSEDEKRTITADGAEVTALHPRTDGKFGYYLVTDMADDHGGLATFTF